MILRGSVIVIYAIISFSDFFKADIPPTKNFVALLTPAALKVKAFLPINDSDDVKIEFNAASPPPKECPTKFNSIFDRAADIALAFFPDFKY